MTADPRAALSDLIAALERHLEVCASGRDQDDPSVAAASDQVVDAFELYDEALAESYGVDTPLAVYDEDLDDDDFDDDEDDGDFDDDEDDDDEDEDDEDDARPYTGLDDEDFDLDDSPRS